MKVLIVNRFFGGAQIPTGRMAEDVARVLVEGGHEVTALASTGTYAGAEKRAQHGAWRTERGAGVSGTETRIHRHTEPEAEWPEMVPRQTPGPRGTLCVEEVRVPKWMLRALAWVWFTWQARKRIPRMDWDVCILMTDPPLLPLLAAQARPKDEGTKAACGGNRGLARWPQGNRVTSDESGKTEKRPEDRTTAAPKHRAKRRIAVWLMDLYPEALAASGRIGTWNPIYRWYFEKRQRALAAADLLICLGEAQKALVERYEGEKVGRWEGSNREQGTGDGEQVAGKTERPNYRPTEIPTPTLTQRVRTVVVPPWDDREEVVRADDRRLKNLALYAGNLGEAHCFEEILSAAPHLPGDWTIRFAARGAKLAALKAAASGIRHAAEGIRHTAGPVEYASHSIDQGGLKLTDLKLKTAGAVVHVSGYASEEETPGLFASARVHLITMSPGWEGIVVPSKLYGCIRTGRPVLFIGPENADTAREIRAHDWGKVLPPGASGEEVAGAILELASRETRATEAQNGAAEVAGELIRLAEGDG